MKSPLQPLRSFVPGLDGLLYPMKCSPLCRLVGLAAVILTGGGQGYGAVKAGVCVSANLSIAQFDSHANNDRDRMKLIPERTASYNKGNGKVHGREHQGQPRARRPLIEMAGIAMHAMSRPFP